MRCPYCGKTLAPNAHVCPVCGKSLQRRPSAQPVRRKKSWFAALLTVLFGEKKKGRKRRKSRFLAPNERWNPKFFVACGVILAVIILIPVLIAVAVHNSKDEPLESRAIQSFYSKTSGKTSVVFAGKAYDKAIVGKVAETEISADGLTQALLTEGGALYYVTTSDLSLVANNVRSFVLSADGSHLAYVMENAPEEAVSGEETQTERAEETTRAARLSDELTTEETTEYVPSGGEVYLEYMETSLFLYSGADGSAPLVANHVAPSSISLSPNGSYVGYAVTAGSGESFDGFVFSGGVTSSLGKDTVPIAVSDDGLRQYYLKFESLEDNWVQKLFSKNGESEVKIGEFTDGKRLLVYLNQDLSQIIFSFTGEDGAFFHFGLSDEKIKLANGFSPVLPRGLRQVQNGKTVIVPVETFTKTVFRRADGAVQYIDAKLNCLDVGVSGKSLRLSADSKTLYCLSEDGKLVACTVRKSDKKDIASNVMNFDLSPDSKILYYVNTDNELHIRSGSKDTVAAENVYAPGSGLCVTDGGYLYFLQDYSNGKGTLCYLKGSGRVRVLSDVKNAHDIAADTGDNIYYRGDYDIISGKYDLYFGKQKKYSLILNDLG